MRIAVNYASQTHYYSNHDLVRAMISIVFHQDCVTHLEIVVFIARTNLTFQRLAVIQLANPCSCVSHSNLQEAFGR